MVSNKSYIEQIAYVGRSPVSGASAICPTANLLIIRKNQSETKHPEGSILPVGLFGSASWRMVRLSPSTQCSLGYNGQPVAPHSVKATADSILIGNTLVWECIASMKHKPGRMPPIAKKAKK